MTPLTRVDAYQALERLRANLLARIPPTLPAKGRKYLGYVVEEQINSARFHLDAIYQAGLAVGEDFSPLPEGAAHSKYTFWVEGIHRHIQHVDASLGRGNLPPPRVES